MDKLLKPAKLSIDPNSSAAAKEWNHWSRTFKSYVSRYVTSASEEEANADKLAALINCATPEVFEYIDQCETYDEAEAVLQKLYVKQPNNIFARHRLQTAKQKPDQSLAEFHCLLMKLAKDCDFREVTAAQYRDDMIRDSFISGILSTNIRQRLLEHKTLSMKEAYDQALTIDDANRNCRMFGEVSHRTLVVPTPEVNSVEVVAEKVSEFSAAAATKGVCFKCGNSQPHDFKNCRAGSFTCYQCGEKGHVRKACRLQKKFGKSSRSSKPEHSALVAVDELAYSFCVANSIRFEAKSSLIELSAEVNGVIYRALLDTGSSKSFLDASLSARFNLLDVQNCFQVSMAQVHNQARISKVARVRLCVLGNTYEDINLHVMRNLCADILLGLDFLKLHNQVIFKLRGPRDDLVVYQDNCAVVAADVKTPSLFNHLLPGWKPIATKSRRFNEQDRMFIKETVSKWKESGTVRPSRSPWRAQCVVVKNNGKIQRLAIDYSQTVNLFTEKDGFPIPLIEDIVNDLARFKFFASYDLKKAYHQIPISEGDKPFTAFEASGELLEFNVIPFGVTNGGPIFQRIMTDIIKEDHLVSTFVYFDNVVIGSNSLQELEARALRFKTSMEKRAMTLNDSKTIYGVTELNMLGYCVGNSSIKPDPERLTPLLEMPAPSSPKSLKRVLGLFAYYAKWIPKFSDRIWRLKSAKEFPLKPEELREFEGLKCSLFNCPCSATSN